MASFTACRFGQITFGYFAASLAAAGVIALMLALVIGPYAVLGFMYAVPIVAACGLIPAIFLIVHAERTRLSSVKVYVASGAAIGFVSGFLVWLPAGGASSPAGAFVLAIFAIVPGAVAGWVYYAVAGHDPADRR